MASGQEEKLPDASAAPDDAQNTDQQDIHRQRNKRVQAENGNRPQEGRVRPSGSEVNPEYYRNVLVSRLFVAFLLLSSLVLVYFVFRESRSLNSILRDIDQVQRVGSQAASINEYRNAARQAETAIDYLRIFKRVYQIAQREHRIQYMAEVTAKAVDKFPNNENLWAYRISFLLDAERYTDAVTASAYLESSRYSSIRGEVLLRSIALARQNSQGNSGTVGSVENAVDERWTIADILGRSPHGAATYISLARLFQEPHFAWNAVLIYMLNGQKDKALALVRELRSQTWLNTLAAGLVAYDNRDWLLAAEFLEVERAKQVAVQNLEVETLQYLGDSYAFEGNYSKVIEVLSSASSLLSHSLSVLKSESVAQDGFPISAPAPFPVAPSIENRSLADISDNLGSWELFYNLASAYRAIGDNTSAFEALLQGRSIFPDISELLLLLNMVAPPDEKAYAQSVLTDFISKGSDDQPYLALASLIFEDRRIARQQFTTKLWGLFSKSPDNERILHYLLWYYIGLNQTEEVALVLERYRNLVLRKDDGSNELIKDYPVWVKEYMAINDILMGNFTRAKDIFNELIEIAPSWYLYYNFANVFVYEGDFPSAIGYLQKSLEYVDNIENKINAYYRMLVLSQIAGENYFTVSENEEIDNILEQYIMNNYRFHGEEHSREEYLEYAKLDSLLLWHLSNGSELLEDPDSYRVEALQQDEYRGGPQVGFFSDSSNVEENLMRGAPAKHFAQEGQTASQ